MKRFVHLFIFVVELAGSINKKFQPMKKIFFAAWIIAGTILCSCKNNQNKPDTASSDSAAVRTDSTRHTVYACPMDPEVTSDQPGKCPKCGMDLEIKNQ